MTRPRPSIALSSGLTLAEEIALLRLNADNSPTKGSTWYYREAISVALLSEWGLWGRLSTTAKGYLVNTTSTVSDTFMTPFDVLLDKNPLDILKTIRYHQKKIEATVYDTLIRMNLVERSTKKGLFKNKDNFSLTPQGATLVEQRRKFYREILSGKITAPQAESILLDIVLKIIGQVDILNPDREKDLGITYTPTDETWYDAVSAEIIRCVLEERLLSATRA